MTDEEFRELLENVPRSYPDFVDGVFDDATDFGFRDKIVDFIRENPDATAGKVATLTFKLLGILE